MTWSFPTCLLVATSLFVAGCQGASNITTPAADISEKPQTVSVGMISTEPGLSQGAALFQFTVDPQAMTATVSPVQQRVAQETDDTFLLSLEQFITDDTITVDEVSADADSINVTFHIKHPFPAPADCFGPATYLNRADLSFAGQLLFLTDVETTEGHRYFGETEPGQPFPIPEVVVDTSLIRNADTYLQPAGLLGLTGYLANTFPAVLVVDATDPGVYLNNFDPAAGWQLPDTGCDNGLQWYGYEVLHQGDQVWVPIELDRAELSRRGPVNLTMALLAKYNDPRGGATPEEKRANRLPLALPDEHRFAYRMPYGALDVSHIEVYPPTGCGPYADGPSTIALHLRVVDWDARASGSPFENLADDPGLSRVPGSSTGIPLAAIGLPQGLLTSERTVFFGSYFSPYLATDDDRNIGGEGGDQYQDSGAANDRLYLTHPMTFERAPGLAGAPVHALMAVIDPTENHYKNGVLPVQDVPFGPGLTPILATQRPRLIGYQVAPLTFLEGAPLRTGWARSDEDGLTQKLIAVDSSGAAIVAGALDYLDPQNRIRKLDIAGNDVWSRQLDGVGTTAIDIAVGQDESIWVAGYFNGPMSLAGIPYELPGDSAYAAFLLQMSSDGTELQALVFGSQTAGASTVLTATTIAEDGDPIIGGSYSSNVTLLGESHTSVGGSDLLFARLQPDLQSSDWQFSVGGPGGQYPRNLEIDASGRVTSFGGTGDVVDFGGGLRTPSLYGDSFVLGLAATGEYAWDRYWGSNRDGNEVTGIAIAPDASIFVSGQPNLPFDFGGGERPLGTGPLHLVHYGTDGAFLNEWHWQADPGYSSSIQTCLFRQDGALIVAGAFRGIGNLGTGPFGTVGSSTSFIGAFDPVSMTPDWISELAAGSVAADHYSGRITPVLAAPDNTFRLIGSYTKQIDLDPGPCEFRLLREGGVMKLNAVGTWD